MKKIVILLISITIICSCQYKVISPFDSVNNGGNNNNGNTNNNNNNNNIYIIYANATEVEIKYALDRNREATGKNIIAVAGYISINSTIFDNIKNALQNEVNIILDLSEAVMESNYTYTLENALFLQTVYFASSQKIIANFFKGCTSLESVQLPSILLTIDNTSFENCSSLKNLEYLGTSPNIIASTPFAGTIKPSELYLPNVAKDPGDDSWKKFLGADWVNIHYGKSMPK